MKFEDVKIGDRFKLNHVDDVDHVWMRTDYEGGCTLCVNEEGETEWFADDEDVRPWEVTR
jgi:hypothetical protein